MFSVLFLKIDRSRYEFVDALAKFDPVNDWLLNEKSYLTWREWGQQLPGDSEPIALMSSPDRFLMQPRGWMGADMVWMRSVMSKRFSDLTNTNWQPSNFRGLLSTPREETSDELMSKLELFNALVARDISDIQTVQYEEALDAGWFAPTLSFGDDGQITGLIARFRHHGSANPIWRFIRPSLVEKFIEYQHKQLELAV